MDADAGPVTLLDVGDNVGGGSPADGTLILQELIRTGSGPALVVLFDPAAVQACVAAGVGTEVSLRVGGKSDDLHGPPIPIRGRVRCLHDGAFVEDEPRHGGARFNNQGLTALVETREGHAMVLTSLRMAPMSLEQVLSLGIKPKSYRILVAKGAIAPVAAYEPVSSRMIYVDTPGITSANPDSLRLPLPSPPPLSIRAGDGLEYSIMGISSPPLAPMFGTELACLTVELVLLQPSNAYRTADIKTP